MLWALLYFLIYVYVDFRRGTTFFFEHIRNVILMYSDTLNSTFQIFLLYCTLSRYRTFEKTWLETEYLAFNTITVKLSSWVSPGRELISFHFVVMMTVMRDETLVCLVEPFNLLYVVDVRCLVDVGWLVGKEVCRSCSKNWVGW